MKKSLFIICLAAMLSSCSIFVGSRHHGAGVSVGAVDPAKTDSTKTIAQPTSVSK
jgi:hypothetical protein